MRIGTLRSLTTHREIMDRLIAEHGGRIANTAGDSVLAEFPSAVDAVRCAVQVQEALASLDQDKPQRSAPAIPDRNSRWRRDGAGWRPVGRRGEHRRATGEPRGAWNGVYLRRDPRVCSAGCLPSASMILDRRRSRISKSRCTCSVSRLPRCQPLARHSEPSHKAAPPA